MDVFPRFGCFPFWPVEGVKVIHPDDVDVVSRLIPSERLMKRESFDGEYYHYRYGRFSFRLRPCLWLEVIGEGVDIGDPIEMVGVGMERELFVGTIAGAYFSRRKGRILYRIERSGEWLPGLCVREHFRLLDEKTPLRPGTIDHPTPRWDETNTKDAPLELE